MMDWIRLSDKKPEKHECVDIWRSFGQRHANAIYDGSDCFEVENSAIGVSLGEPEYYTVSDVSHWIRVSPPSPEEG